MIKYRAGKILSEKEYIEYVTISIKKGGKGCTHPYILSMCVYYFWNDTHKTDYGCDGVFTVTILYYLNISAWDWWGEALLYTIDGDVYW